MRKTIYFILSMALLALFGQASAASFNCKNAHSDVEIMVCMDYRLSGLDDQLAYVYAKANASDDLKAAQRDWVKQRNQCKDFKCLVDAYANRIKAIDSQATPIFAYPSSDTGKWAYWAKEQSFFFESFQTNKDGDLLIESEAVQPNLFDLATYTYDTRRFDRHHGLNLRTGLMETTAKQFPEYSEDYPYFLLSMLMAHASSFLSGTKDLYPLSDYAKCDTTIDIAGVGFKRPNEPWRKGKPHQVLLVEKYPVITHGRDRPDNETDCDEEEDIEAEIRFHIHDHSQDFIWHDNLYAMASSPYSSWLLRFDGAMNTYNNTMIGHFLFLPESDDLGKLVAPKCGEPNVHNSAFVCVDRQLSKLTKVVEQFFKAEMH